MGHEKEMKDQLDKLAVYRCNAVLKATRSNEKFDPSFVVKILTKLEDESDLGLSDKQYEAVEVIYESWVHD